ncbi:hypothetical protein ABN197_18855 [Providencia alcalifaciens]|uniref:hypothetical protein n=1 Tax=Providencia alcalifaciens TaxID=126385 RepID=UPI0032DBC6AF
MEFKGAPAPWVATKREFFIELYDDNGNYVGLTNSKANAHLIAMAPELLETLIEVVEMQSKNYGNGMVTHMQLANLAKKAKIVIEKALGQQ